MAVVIKNKVEPYDPSIIVPIQPRGANPPFFCLHGAGGGVFGYIRLSHWLGSEQPLYGIQGKGFDDGQEPRSRIEDMASDYLQEIFKVQRQGPYYLLGYSFGGIVAYEIACQMKSLGQQVALLGILDTYAISRSNAIMQLWRPKNLLRFIRNIAPWLYDQWQIRFVRDQNKISPKNTGISTRRMSRHCINTNLICTMAWSHYSGYTPCLYFDQFTRNSDGRS